MNIKNQALVFKFHLQVKFVKLHDYPDISNQELNLLYQFWIHTELVARQHFVEYEYGDNENSDAFIANF